MFEMVKRYYCIPHRKEVGYYNEAGGITDFPRGVLMAYGDCCLTTGFATKEQAEAWMKKYPCKKGVVECP